MAEAAFDSNAVTTSSKGVGMWVFVGITVSIILLLHHFHKKRRKSHDIHESPHERRERMLALREKRLQKLQDESEMSGMQSPKDASGLRRRKSPANLIKAENGESTIQTDNVRESAARSWQEEQQKYFKDIQKPKETPNDGSQECVTELVSSPKMDTTTSTTDEGTVSMVNDSSTSESEVSLTQQKKRSKKKTFLPPPQLLCEALSHIFKRKVLVESNAEAGSWGGVGWKKRTSDYSTITPITLSLHLHQPMAMENEWEALCTVFPKLLDKSLCAKLFPKHDVKLAALCHSRARNVYRNGFALLMAGDDGFDEVQSCIEALYLWLAKQVAEWIRPEAEAAMIAIANDDEQISDLFSDEYCGDITPFSGTSTSKPLDALYSLLEESAAPVVTASFLEDLFRAYNESAEEDRKVPRIFLSQALKRLALAKQSSSFSSAVLTHRVTALSSLLSSTSVCQALSSMMQEEVSQMEDKNGREIQTTIQLAPLFEIAAYAIPLAGTERGEGPRKGPFL
jgi:hypothetical protein